ncbi:glycoside hydrolase family 78 protein [Actinomyces sp. B33]|uniref:alpha-L-rhamnosidase n=1 Tax=Actinomyces sp. B33 TaxID=2942131 RepID=UPI002340B0CD|nr:alpha-L-rhamnosidase [Actinomyces sp. B33]MDC4233428.1 glycoside hydrolase family 78 protein [Actinomyces sp. B33]
MPVPATPSPAILDPATRVTSLRSRFDPSLVAVALEEIRLRWAVACERPGASQTAYQIRHRADSAPWTVAEPVLSDAAVDIPAPGGPLNAREQREYCVRIATDTGWSPWSSPLLIEGSLDSDSFAADVISIPTDLEGPAAILRTEFTLPFTPVRARLYLSALGLVHARINGADTSDALLTPGWTEYDDRILIDAIDATDLVHEGRNAISLTVGDGWYRGRMGFAGRTEIYGDRSGAIARLEILGEAGQALTVATDDSWVGGFGPIRAASIYDGTTIDLRLDAGDPSLPGFDTDGWLPVDILDCDHRVFHPRAVPPVRVIGGFDMNALSDRIEDAADGVVLDAGQNISGWVRLTVEGEAGTEVVVRHAEVLDPDGSLHTASLRSARATDRYILGESGRIELEPVFTFHGFRYADVTGPVRIVSARAIAISTDLPRRATFSSSHNALDRFHENVVWSQLDNFVSIPTDCPQRDERLGWTGDAQAFAATANTLFDAEAFWASWLRDLELAQNDNGAVASLVPNIIAGDARMGGRPIDDMGRAGWADAATIVPWSTYASVGSPEILRSQLDSMRRWVDHLRRRAGDDVLLPDEPFQYGDWLDPDAPVDQPWNGKTPALFVANCFYIHSTRLLAASERLIGDPDEAQRLEDLATRVADAVWTRWKHEAHETQTGAAMCLEFGIVPDRARPGLVAALADNVRRENGRIATGFLGTPLVLFALSRAGKWEEAYTMLLRRQAPSWLYQVDRGATTVWERWDAIKEDGSIHAGEMAGDEGGMISFNHYAYGAVIDWVYRNVAGLEPMTPGYRTTRIGPRPATALTRAQASIATTFGDLSIAWEVDPDLLTIRLVIPFGVEAVLDLLADEGSIALVDGAPAPDRLGHGAYTITLTRPRIIEVDAAAS